MSSRYLTVHAPEFADDVVSTGLDAAEKTGFNITTEKDVPEGDWLHLNADYNNTTVWFELSLSSDRERHKCILVLGLEDVLFPSNWSDGQNYAEFVAAVVDLACELAAAYDAEYVPLASEFDYKEVTPTDMPFADHIEHEPNLAVYSESLLAELGGFEELYGGAPWRYAEMDSGHVVAMTEDGPWRNSEFMDLQLRGPQQRETDMDSALPDPFSVLDPDEELVMDSDTVLNDLAKSNEEAADALREMDSSVQWRFGRAYETGAVDSDGLATAVTRYDSLDTDSRDEFRSMLAGTGSAAVGFAGKVDEATFETIVMPKSRGVPSFGGTYGTDAVVPKDDIAQEFTNDALTLERVYRDGSNNLRRIGDDSFVRRLIDSDGPVGELPADADPDDEWVSALTKWPIPPAFARMNHPDEATIVSKTLALDIETSKVELLEKLAGTTESVVVSEDELAAIEGVLDDLEAMDDEDSIDQYIKANGL
ncbi:hypothetical protein EGH22_19210 [Halomicroarcula sp. F28]|uniref:hypothetical protein n=1 Tax=Haloarcula salinisoli TaxID=2487746 RepID=UPI001C73C5F2|nr:hypothetical protein [Halomicroarcula salinisoli]MBX0288465.1 hypothetical protein [Halomicroarcula salinisoli]